jgi:His-Xaa-Ser system radical SAM maturase HxsC
VINLHGRVADRNIKRKLSQLVYRLDDHLENKLDWFSLYSNESQFKSRSLTFVKNGKIPPSDGREYVSSPAELDYLVKGDIISLSVDAGRINVIWRGGANANSLLLTERCDNYCLMCSQPPKTKNDDWLLEQAFDAISLMPQSAKEIGFTGGEPTFYGQRFIDLVKHVNMCLPSTALHILSNGRKFSDVGFTEKYASVANENTMVGIPIYGSEETLHDYVVQAKGAFNETVNGILNLGELGQMVELRVVLHKATAPQIVQIAEFICRNLPFVDQVALMGLEMMGLARGNFQHVWIDPVEYIEELAEAVQMLAANKIHTMVYNHQLCVLHHDIWQFAVKSISDWKNEYDTVCKSCEVVDVCGGFFHSAKYGSSKHIQPMTRKGYPIGKKPESETLSIGESKQDVWQRRSIQVTASD